VWQRNAYYIKISYLPIGRRYDNTLWQVKQFSLNVHIKPIHVLLTCLRHKIQAMCLRHEIPCPLSPPIITYTLIVIILKFPKNSDYITLARGGCYLEDMEYGIVYPHTST
jgi:hypothetical protein